jgi:hypothetical protein
MLAAAAAVLALAAAADGAWSAFAPDETAFASSASVRSARAAWDAACIQPDNAAGCGMAALLGDTAEHYRTLDRVLVLGAYSCTQLRAVAAHAARRGTQPAAQRRSCLPRASACLPAHARAAWRGGQRCGC